MAKRPSIHVVKQKLKSGKHPKEFGAKYLGEGCFKTAYKLGPWVIKDNDQTSCEKFPPKLRKGGLYPPRQYRVNAWLVQPYYKPVPKKDRQRLDEFNCKNKQGGWYDVKAENCGVDERGRIVAFDW